MNLHLKTSALILLATALPAVSQTTTLIDFEPDAKGFLPDGSLAEDKLKLNTQFSSLGINFGVDKDNDLQIDKNSYLYLEAVGASDGHKAYKSENGSEKEDTAAAGFESQLGDWFIQTKDNGKDTWLVTFDNPQSAASGEIWDIDAKDDKGKKYEQWSVTAYDANGNVIATLESPTGIHDEDPTSLDSKPWTWSFDQAGAEGISIVALTNIGTHKGDAGFDNISGTSMGSPEASFSILAATFGLLGLSRRKRG